MEKRNYRFFPERYVKYIEPVAFTYAYCLMKNHLHLLIRTKTPEEQAAGETLRVSMELWKHLDAMRGLRRVCRRGNR